MFKINQKSNSLQKPSSIEIGGEISIFFKGTTLQKWRKVSRPRPKLTYVRMKCFERKLNSANPFLKNVTDCFLCYAAQYKANGLIPELLDQPPKKPMKIEYGDGRILQKNTGVEYTPTQVT